jgi:hypothetical protein
MELHVGFLPEQAGNRRRRAIVVIDVIRSP